MPNVITSNTLSQIANMENSTVKFYGTVGSLQAGTTTYYFKPDFKCKLVGARLHVQTAAGANLTATGKVTKETDVTDTDLAHNTITCNTSISAGTAVSNDDLLQLAVAAVASLGTVAFYPGANYATSENHFYPEDKDAVRVDFAGGNNATLLVGFLELEFLPII